MEHVIAERELAEPASFEKLEAALRANQACLVAHRVRHLRTYISLDGKRTICEYEAPDAEAVRSASQRAGMPYERVWTARVFVSGEPK